MGHLERQSTVTHVVVAVVVLIGPSRPSPLTQMRGGRRRHRAHRVRPGVQDARPAQEAPLHARDHRDLPGRHAHSDPRCRLHVRSAVCGRGVRQPGPLRSGEHVQRRRAAADHHLRAGHHAVHHGEHHPSAADRGHPAPGSPEEGGPGRYGEDHAVHPLPHRGARHPAGHRPGGHRPQRRPLLRLHGRVEHRPGPRDLHHHRHGHLHDRRYGHGHVAR